MFELLKEAISENLIIYISFLAASITILFLIYSMIYSIRGRRKSILYLPKESISLAKSNYFFKADLDEITKIQMSFYRNAEKFIYFRKGEFANIFDVVSRINKLNNEGKGLLFKYSKTLLEKNDLNPYVFINSGWSNKNNNGLLELQRLGSNVKIIPKEKIGKMRYFLNEKQFCIFFRLKENSFFGFIGDDLSVVNYLKELFQSEIEESTKLE